MGSSASSAGARRARCPTPPTWSTSSTAPSRRSTGSADPAAPGTRWLVDLVERLHAVAVAVEVVDAALRGVPGVRALLGDPQAALLIADRVEQLTTRCDALERELDDGLGAALAVTQLEDVNAALVRARDAVWAVGRDRLRTAREVAALAGADPSVAALEAFFSVQVALSAIDRLEVRGRDSAGLHLLVRRSRPRPRRARHRAAGRRACRRPAVRFGVGARRRRRARASSTRPRPRSVSSATTPRCCAPRSATTRCCTSRSRRRRRRSWCSATRAGRASASSPRPTPTRSTTRSSTAHERPYVVGALNGDVDNYADLKALEGLQVPAEITTDAKVIPALVARRLESRCRPSQDAFRTTVSRARGLGGHRRPDRRRPRPPAPRRCGAAARRSTSGWPRTPTSSPASPTAWSRRRRTYLRMDGETPADPERAAATRGQVVVLDANGAGTLAGIERFAFDGTPLPVHDDELQHAEITTRDIDRGDFPHFLLKEISEAPASFRKTLRGKVVERDGRLTVTLGNETLPESLRARLRDGSIRRVVVIGQGTAAIAGQSLAAVLTALADDRAARRGRRRHRASRLPARATTCPTRSWSRSARAAPPPTPTAPSTSPAPAARRCVAIVNRRNSDLVDKSDGVLYTSDGRDVEMAVPSTKAFYAQIAAGFLLADRHRRRARHSADAGTVHEILRRAPRRCPTRWRRCSRCRPPIAGHRAAARGVAPLLGRRRQRSQPHRRRRGADQGLGALLQVDRLRLAPRTRSTSTSRPSR